MAALVSASLVNEEASAIAELGDFLEMDPDYVHATLKAQVSQSGSQSAQDPTVTGDRWLMIDSEVGRRKEGQRQRLAGEGGERSRSMHPNLD